MAVIVRAGAKKRLPLSQYSGSGEVFLIVGFVISY